MQNIVDEDLELKIKGQLGFETRAPKCEDCRLVSIEVDGFGGDRETLICLLGPFRTERYSTCKSFNRAEGMTL